MNRAPSLPDRLRYLQPFRGKFARRMDDLNEDSGAVALYALLRKRIKGLTDADARNLLAEDALALEKWLETPGLENDPLVFAGVMFAPDLVPDVLEHLREEKAEADKPFPWVEMELPPKAKIQRFEKHRDGGMFVRWNGLYFTVGDVPEERFATAIQYIGPQAPNDKIQKSQVQFGNFVGTKFVRMTETVQGQCKTLDYLLAGPGWNVHIRASAVGKKLDLANWDEGPLEALFATIRVLSKKPAPEAR